MTHMDAEWPHRLLKWYRSCARELPWRADPRPYHVLLSEIMLQQTRVDTVLPYYAAFLERWPTLGSLADAELDALLTAWAGLGYYRRARNLHRCAQAARDGLPATVEGLRALPGIGPYTAGAIASIAFGVRTPVVDGNVERVLCRVNGLTADPRRGSGKRALWALAEALVPARSPGDHNQALMELGALVCMPRAPRCHQCPLSADCVASKGGFAESLPRLRPRVPPTPIQGVAGLLRLDGGWLLGRRHHGGLLGGLWEPIRLSLSVEDAASEVLTHGFYQQTGIEVSVVGSLGRLVHVFTHRRLQLEVFELRRRGGVARAGPDYAELRAVHDLDSVGLSALARKVISLGG